MSRLAKYDYLVQDAFGVDSLQYAIFKQKFAGMSLVDAFGEIIMDVSMDGKTVIKLSDSLYRLDAGNDLVDLGIFKSLPEKYAYYLQFPIEMLIATLDHHALVSELAENGDVIYRGGYEDLSGFIHTKIIESSLYDEGVVLDLLSGTISDPSNAIHYTLLHNLSLTEIQSTKGYSNLQVILIRYLDDDLLRPMYVALETVHKYRGVLPVIEWAATPWVWMRILERSTLISVAQRSTEVIEWVIKKWIH